MFMKKFNTQKKCLFFIILNFSYFFTFSLFHLLTFSPSHLFTFEIPFLPYTPEETVLMQGIQVFSEGKDACGNNPAGCGMENKKSFSFGYTLWNMRENFSSLTLFLPRKFANIGIKLKYSNFGETELVSEEPVNVKKERIYTLVLNTSLGEEMFLPGLFLGIDCSVGRLKFDRDITLTGIKFGGVYVINFVSTELHLCSSLGTNISTNKTLSFYGGGIKYYLPEYNTFLNFSFNKNVYNFITVALETELVKNFIFLCGYETATEKSLTNYSFGLKSVQKNFDIVLGTRYNFELGWTISVGVTVRR